MILVDTSVWIAAFRRAHSDEAAHLRILLWSLEGDFAEMAALGFVRVHEV